ncbi:hypothetical protein FGO68_gene940 [Halteria grandinella]|uniref:Uncharacterized protein n=1 Tax=Halteria grandinella TaxID=5974 RepID=A0A8J8NZY9_HALGN|nr:hypothetical protein FGO68_gene940 [Halteria grandinella]
MYQFQLLELSQINARQICCSLDISYKFSESILIKSIFLFQMYLYQISGKFLNLQVYLLVILKISYNYGTSLCIKQVREKLVYFANCIIKVRDEIHCELCLWIPNAQVFKCNIQFVSFIYCNLKVLYFLEKFYTKPNRINCSKLQQRKFVNCNMSQGIEFVTNRLNLISVQLHIVPHTFLRCEILLNQAWQDIFELIELPNVRCK